MLLLDLKTISGDRAPLARTWGADDFAGVGPGDYRITSAVRLEGEVRKARREYRLVGHLSADLEIPCSRCLEPFGWRAEIPFDVLYLPQSHNVGEGELEIAEEDLTTAFYEGEAIDLGHLVREQCHLSLPMKPLCREACRGLCPQCGTNLNLAPCHCRTDWLDPRLEPLRRLRG